MIGLFCERKVGAANVSSRANAKSYPHNHPHFEDMQDVEMHDYRISDETRPDVSIYLPYALNIPVRSPLIPILRYWMPLKERACPRNPR